MRSPGTLTGLLYHRSVQDAARHTVNVAFLGMALLGGSAAAAPADRLDRFRELTASIDPSQDDALREIYALLDGEIAESLAGGGVFASPSFLAERLEAFTETWGGLTARLLPLERALAAAFSFTEWPRGSTVRVYARDGGSAPLAVLAEEGRPQMRALPGPAGARQILVLWEGAPAADRARTLRFDVLREEADGVRVAWRSSSDLAPEGFTARWYAVRGTEITVRHEERYPGWAPGCEGQAEFEDVYRLSKGSGAFTRATRREINSWHRDLHAAAERLFLALVRGDRATLGRLVPDAAVRARLPSSLRSEPACDGPPARDGAVAIAAAAGEREPWTLTFRRVSGGWRLSAAAPVVP